jgi:hypothetical protein
MRHTTPAGPAFVVLLLCTLGLASHAAGHAGAAGPAPQEAQDEPRVALTQSAGPPGGRVAVPIQLTVPEGVDLGTLSLTIRVPADSLAFQSIALGGLADGVGMTAETKTATEGSDVVLSIRLSTPEQGGARVPLPSGPIGDLLFEVSKDAKAETEIRLPLDVTATAARGNAPVKVQKKDGSVVVSNPAVDTCFFYMH